MYFSHFESLDQSSCSLRPTCPSIIPPPTLKPAVDFVPLFRALRKQMGAFGWGIDQSFNCVVKSLLKKKNWTCWEIFVEFNPSAPRLEISWFCAQPCFQHPACVWHGPCSGAQIQYIHSKHCLMPYSINTAYFHNLQLFERFRTPPPWTLTLCTTHEFGGNFSVFARAYRHSSLTEVFKWKGRSSLVPLSWVNLLPCLCVD